MKRESASFPIHNFSDYKEQVLCWANQYNVCSFLDNNQYQSTPESAQCIVAVGALKKFPEQPDINSLPDLKKFEEDTNDWLFGHVSYNYKKQIHGLENNFQDNIAFPDIFFFQPAIVIQLFTTSVIISSATLSPQEIYNQHIQTTSQKNNLLYKLSFVSKFSKQDYITTVKKLQQHIARGDCYEINFCQEFFSENIEINPLSIYQKLNEASPNPFAVFYKLNDAYLMCASPERYFRKDGNSIISQPIKGTYKRNKRNAVADEALKNKLLQSNKERSENVMIVDLVRNDLSKICKEGTVEVDELFGIYTFPQVHQMISTISGKLSPDISIAEILKATFPMGSMTGAPKKRVMELIDVYEKSNRGIFSGCVGYISPEKNADFNVVIRSMLYNSTSKYLSYLVGSGITFNSVAEQEYDECLLKASAIKNIFNH